MLKFLDEMRRAFWRAFEDNCFAIAKASAYSSILALFPALLLVASVLAASRKTEAFLREIAFAVGRVLPPGAAATARHLVETAAPQPMLPLITGSVFTLLAATGIMISWMEGFRNAYRLPKIWGFWKERAIALLLVVLALIPLSLATMLVGFGAQIETWMVLHSTKQLGAVIFLLFTGLRWLIAILTSIAVIALIYHHGVPRTQPWHRVLPGAVVATFLWLLTTALFAWYVKTFAVYSVVYGSLGAAIALLVWMYLVSIVILVGAEFNARRYPRTIGDRRHAPRPQPAREEAAALQQTRS
ncbi:MAG TPA: YihY/virulence factor BrkB family protein [Terriglobales bacterium]|nr:YihY/virulence factor BrkB family protein [Terriglobales bacterium]